MDTLIEESINRASAIMVKDLRERGSRGGTRFFDTVDGLAAVKVSDVTGRPTREPSKWPTTKPSPS